MNIIILEYSKEVLMSDSVIIRGLVYQFFHFVRLDELIDMSFGC